MKFDFGGCEETPLTLIEGPAETSKEPNNMILEAFKADRSTKVIKQIKKGNQAEIWNLPQAKYQKVLKGTMLDNDMMRSIILFFLNKIPGRNTTCLKCKVNMTSQHFVLRNKNIWKETQILCSRSKYTALEHIRNAPLDENLISKLIASAMNHFCFWEMKSFLTGIAIGIQKSAKYCVWLDKEEHHVL